MWFLTYYIIWFDVKSFSALHLRASTFDNLSCKCLIIIILVIMIIDNFYIFIEFINNNTCGIFLSVYQKLSLPLFKIRNSLNFYFSLHVLKTQEISTSMVIYVLTLLLANDS